MNLIAKKLDSLFQKVATPTKPDKQKRRLEEDDSSDNEHQKTGLNSEDKAWLKECFTGIAEVMHGSVNESLAPIKEDISQNTNAIADLKRDNVGLRQELLELKARVNGTESAIAKAASGDPLPTPPPGINPNLQSSRPSSGHDPHEPPLMVMGNLGNKLDRPSLEEHARVVLRMIAETERFTQTNLYAPLAFGSTCHVEFLSAAEANRVRNAIKRLGHKFPGIPEPVWMDRKKDKQELAPGRFLKSMVSLAQEQLQTKQMDPGKVIKCGASKKIYFEFEHQLVGRLDRFTGKWIWGAFFKEHFDEEALKKMENAALIHYM